MRRPEHSWRFKESVHCYSLLTLGATLSYRWWRLVAVYFSGAYLLLSYQRLCADLLQTSWAFREAPLLRRCLFAIDDALPIAFIAMLFGELYGAIAGLGFQVTVASATYQYQDGLGYFLIAAIFLAALSMILRFIVRLAGFQAGQIEAG